ncbi:sugar transferase [Paenibacillus sp. Soil522]|uniref:sugar transferase n=1 Tax=Paenibacillus sp. Soil522 TaxID=1736388 RepID=UPI0009D6EDD2|nr:sugar transferase [Paenibacillus sp. Soil522]
MDILISLIGLLMLSPVILLISMLIKFDDPKTTIFFKQLRVGKNGNSFFIYKFRTMHQNAENILMENNNLYKKYLKNNYKLEQNEDPRITKIGLWLRKTSMDEIPQLINVLKGEMSLVGPRPVVPEELEEYKSKKNEFLSVKPGMTGYWQICGRSNVGYPERVDLELYYVKRKSLMFDLLIIFKTIPSVLKKDGAF